VLVIHAWWGLNHFLRKLCERLADEGFAAYAPDLYAGSVAETVEEASRLRDNLDRKTADRAVELALDHLLSQPNLAGSDAAVAVIGFSLGAGFALNLARAKPQRVRAVVLFYGTGAGKFDKVRASIQGHFAQHDDWGAGNEKVAALAARIRSAGLEPQFFTYPGTTHWFFESDRPGAYDKEAANLAWQRTTTFLRSHLQ
jgi:carboxymethylenebutenolidase